jgi:hypothetical protein
LSAAGVCAVAGHNIPATRQTPNHPGASAAMTLQILNFTIEPPKRLCERSRNQTAGVKSSACKRFFLRLQARLRR